MAYFDKIRVNGTDRDIRDANAVHTDAAETLTDAQKATARGNIGAASAADLAGKVNADQGAANAGKALVVGTDGIVTTGDAGIPDAVKAALLTFAQHVAYADSNGAAYYNALQSALYPGAYPQIVATYTPGTHVVYTDDALSTLTPYLSVLYYATEQSEGSAVTGYTLSGTLAEGDSTVTVNYNGYTDTVTVTAVDFYSIAHRASTDDTATHQIGSAEYYTDSDVRYMRIKTAQTARDVIGLTRGYVPMIDESGNTLSIYPFPVPAGATTIKVTFTASGVTSPMYTPAKLLKADGRYRLQSFGTNAASGTSQTLYSSGAPEDAFVIVTTYDSGSHTTRPSSWSVEFE